MNCSVLTVHTMFSALIKRNGLIMKKMTFTSATLISMYQIDTYLDFIGLILLLFLFIEKEVLRAALVVLELSLCRPG